MNSLFRERTINYDELTRLVSKKLRREVHRTTVYNICKGFTHSKAIKTAIDEILARETPKVESGRA